MGIQDRLCALHENWGTGLSSGLRCQWKGNGGELGLGGSPRAVSTNCMKTCLLHYSQHLSILTNVGACMLTRNSFLMATFVAVLLSCSSAQELDLKAFAFCICCSSVHCHSAFCVLLFPRSAM